MSPAGIAVVQFAAALVILACSLRESRRNKFAMATCLVASLLLGAAGLIGLSSAGPIGVTARQEIFDRNQLAIDRIGRELSERKAGPERPIKIEREL